MNFKFPKKNNWGDRYTAQSNFLSQEEIKYINDNQFSIPYSDTTIEGDKEAPYEIRSSKLKWLPLNKKWEGLYQKIYNLINDINSNIWKFNIHFSDEPLQYTEYKSDDKGHYTWHMDLGGGNSTSKRKISVTIQLSSPNEYEGGDLEFFGLAPYYQPFDLNILKQQGTAVIFPSYGMHRVTPVTKGIRKSLVLWVGGSHFK